MYWGEKDTSVFFCEEAYINSNYIAEYYNFLSSFFILFVGMYFINTNIKYIALSGVGVGIGSLILHGMQLHIGQQIDEISMLCLSFLSLAHIEKKRLWNILLKPTILLYLLFSKYYAVFLTIYSSTQGYVVIKLWKHNEKGELSATIFIIGFILWVLDQMACEYVAQYQLHAIWHICTSLTMFFGFKILKDI